VNALNRDLKVGEVVVLDPCFKQCHGTDLFVCESGFGMLAQTQGHAVFGHFLGSTEGVRVEGYDIDEAATAKYQNEVIPPCPKPTSPTK
jgi:hypothetical protein